MAESAHIESELIPKIATGFCSGISRTCDICGAISGAVLAISMLYGRTSPDESLDKTYKLVQKLIDLFKNRFGETNCKKLIKCDLRTEKGQKTYITNHLFEECKRYIVGATRIVVSIIEEASEAHK